MKLPVQIEIAPPGTAATNVTQEVFIVSREQKGPLLQKLLGDYRGSVLVFTRTKHAAKKLARDVRTAGHTANELHSNRSLSQRREALTGFKNGSYRVLVATDIAARGIDVTGIEVVINFDLPMQAEDYIHRIGRTGRAGASGHAISFATPDQRGDLRTIERLLRKTLPVAKLPDSLPKPLPQAYEPERPTYRHTGRPSYGGGSRSSSSSSGSSGSSWQSSGRRPYQGGAPRTGGYPASSSGPRRHR
jgi:ATP-dependent RNA helicase RhlE